MADCRAVGGLVLRLPCVQPSPPGAAVELQALPGASFQQLSGAGDLASLREAAPRVNQSAWETETFECKHTPTVDGGGLVTGRKPSSP